VISLCISSKDEGHLLGQCMDAWLAQDWPETCEIVPVVSGSSIPVAREWAARYEQVKPIYEEVPRGKPAALNQFFKLARGDKLILTDGDVMPSGNVVGPLLRVLADPKVGAVSGRPLSANPIDNMLGWWQYVLCDMIHKRRQSAGWFASGYLCALRAGIVKEIPLESLADDAIISMLVRKVGYRTAYAPDAKVIVRYPTNFGDWVRQKRRTLAGYWQASAWFGHIERTAGSEARGLPELLGYVSGPKHLVWLAALAVARLWAWMLAWWDVRVAKRGLMEIWQPVTSTKVR
jgi:cellulose synthase/poly-beta-1,6-N-acetylglucosamine synthase-like glycosyltransferase